MLKKYSFIFVFGIFANGGDIRVVQFGANGVNLPYLTSDYILYISDIAAFGSQTLCIGESEVKISNKGNNRFETECFDKNSGSYSAIVGALIVNGYSDTKPIGLNIVRNSETAEEGSPARDIATRDLKNLYDSFSPDKRKQFIEAMKSFAKAHADDKFINETYEKLYKIHGICEKVDKLRAATEGNADTREADRSVNATEGDTDKRETGQTDTTGDNANNNSELTEGPADSTQEETSQPVVSTGDNVATSEANQNVNATEGPADGKAESQGNADGASKADQTDTTEGPASAQEETDQAVASTEGPAKSKAESQGSAHSVDQTSLTEGPADKREIVQNDTTEGNVDSKTESQKGSDRKAECKSQSATKDISKKVNSSSSFNKKSNSSFSGSCGSSSVSVVQEDIGWLQRLLSTVKRSFNFVLTIMLYPFVAVKRFVFI